MSRAFLTAIDLAQNELQNPVAQNLAAHPTSPAPKRGQFYMNTTDNTLYWFDGSGWVASKGGSGTPTGPAGGDLTGSYPNPTIGTGKVTSTHILDGTIAPEDLSASAVQFLRVDVKDEGTSVQGDAAIVDFVGAGVVATGATGTATVTIPGTPTGAAGGSLTGTYPNPTVAADAITPAMIANLPSTPANSGDPTSKTYVDAQIAAAVQGLNAKQAVRMATTANITLSGSPTIDGLTPQPGDRVLVKNQTTSGFNGIYVAAAGAWTRATDNDTEPEMNNAYVWVAAGTVNADTAWVQTIEQASLGTDQQGWVQFSGAAQIIAGAGMSKTGNTLDVGAGTGISVLADTVAVDTGVIATVASLANYVPTSRLLTGGVGVLIGGAGSNNLSADRVIDVVPFATTTKGAVPAPGTVTGKFLKDDGTWAAPGGGTVGKLAVGCAAATSTVLPHSFGSDVIVQVYRNSAPFDQVECDVEHTSGSVTVRFAAAPTANAYRIVVMG